MLSYDPTEEDDRGGDPAPGAPAAFHETLNAALSLWPAPEQFDEKAIRPCLKEKFLRALESLKEKVLAGADAGLKQVPLFPLSPEDNFLSDGAKEFRRRYYDDFERVGLCCASMMNQDAAGLHCGVVILKTFNLELLAASDPTTWGKTAIE